MVEPIQKVPPPQRCSEEELELVQDRFFKARCNEVQFLCGFEKEPISIEVSLLLDILMDLRGLRDYAAAPGDSPEERMDWHLEQIRAEFAVLRKLKKS